MAINKVFLLGRLGADPEVRYMDNGVAKAVLRVATNESYSKGGERVTHTEWHRVVLWRGIAETAQKFLAKGDNVYIEGKLTYRTYDNDKGEKKYITEIIAREIYPFLNGKNTMHTPSSENSEKTDQDVSKSTSSEEDELPFF